MHTERVTGCLAHTIFPDACWVISRSEAISEWRELLVKLLKKAPGNIRFSDELQGSREELLQVAR
jgi:hypothetical protein